MNLFTLLTLLLNVAVLATSSVALASEAWFTQKGIFTVTRGLFRMVFFGVETSLGDSGYQIEIHEIIVASCIGLGGLLFLISTLIVLICLAKSKSVNIPVAVLNTIGAVAIQAGAGAYTGFTAAAIGSHEMLVYGWGFYVAWVAVVFAYFATVMAFVARKKGLSERRVEQA